MNRLRRCCLCICDVTKFAQIYTENTKTKQKHAQKYMNENKQDKTTSPQAPPKPQRTFVETRFPFIEDDIDHDGVLKILADAGVGLPAYYDWRTRSGCYFCFYQRKAEWVGLAERHPDLFARAVAAAVAGRFGVHIADASGFNNVCCQQFRRARAGFVRRVRPAA